MYKYIVNDIPPSNNKFMGNNHSFHIYGSLKEKWFRYICKALDSSIKPKEAIEKSEVIITYYFKDKRRRDPDNYSGKFLLDPLVKLRVIKDDSFNNIKLTLKAYTDKDNPRTEIEVVPINEI